MIVTYSNRTYRITYQSIALVENALGNPNLIQISLTTDCEVKVAPMPEYDINYLPNGEYRSWQLTGINTKLNRKEQHFIYARLERASKDALLVFSVNDYNVDGTTGEGTTPSEYYYYIKLGKITATDAVEGATVMREVTLDYGYLATPADRTENFFQLRTDANGNEYIITKYHVVSEQSYTSYATPQTQVPSLFDGIPIDNDTIYWEETDGVRILKAKGGGGEEGTINEETLWQILAKPGSQQISSTHLTDALKNYITATSVDEKISEATKNFVTLDSEQEIAALKHFTAGLSVGAGKHKIYEKDGVVYFEGDLAVTGGITQYALGDTPVSTIMDGVVTDNVTIKKENGKLVVIGGSGSDFDKAAMWKALAVDTAEQINKTHLTDALAAYATITDVDDRIDDLINGAPAAFDTLKEIADVLQGNVDSIGDIFEVLETKWTQDDAKIANWDAAFGWGDHKKAGYAHLAGEEIFTGLKHFTAGLSVGAGKHRLYEKDGVVYFDGDLAVTGGITQYATDGVSVSTIMDGVVTDNVTIKKENGKLVVIGGEGSSFDDAQMWKLLEASTTEQINRSHLTTALQGYATESWASTNLLGKTETASNSNKLQGLTWDNFFSRKYYYLDYGAQSTTNFYPIFFSPNDIELDCEIHSDNVSSLNAYNQNRIHFQLTAQGWSDTGVSFRILSRNNYSDSEITIGAIGYGTKDGGIAIWVRGGKRYRLYCNKTPNMKTSDFTYGSGEKYTVGTNLDGGTNSNVNIAWKNDSNRNDGVVATVDGDVYSATKLQNARNLWGQSFDGTRDISGDIRTNNGSVDALKFGYNPSDNHDGLPWYGFGYYTNNKIGISGYGGIDFFTSSGNTLSLSSNGRTYANSIICSDWLRTTGNTGWYSESWGGGWYMDNADWVKVYNNKNIYTRGKLQTGGDIEIIDTGVFTTSNNVILRKKGFTHTDILRWDWNGTDGDHLKFTIPGTNDQSIYMKLGSGVGLVVTSRIEASSINAKSNVSSYFTAFTSINAAITGSDPDYKWAWYHAKAGDVQRGFTLWSYALGGAANQVASFVAYGGNLFKVFGNILATGGITQYSDQRAKKIVEQITLSLKDIAQSPAIRFKWNGWKQKDDGKTHIGGIAQYVQRILPEAIYNTDGAFTMDYAITGYIFAVNTAKHLLSYETKTDKEIKQLNKRVKYLEKQLKKLGYEETGTLAN